MEPIKREGKTIHIAPAGAHVALLAPGSGFVAVVAHPDMKPYFVRHDGTTEELEITGDEAPDVPFWPR
jgi:hypothetical protein